ncbi:MULTISPECIES: PRC-barrel domain-containing protein [Streptomyces]|uniref:PRC-barrel domain-containing protein n=1 Tax=Streptomyces TaxID=1883 RepID=UPI00017F266D|nr:MULTISPECIES: PRC-barrel domain-containing protein [Streptomyces]AKL70650.1 PRC domain containing protein [Streptomyces sp. Mg1]WBY24422.1 PRC-barrel domain-containing protein [Streptomyces goshikiensis]WSS03803.1 PRC-barrel domain-containing protein [Streptomyces goshikiensis]WSY02914.1 PRC-barrel domain-containing protein [Streptomyces goshikiensis]
MADDMWSYNPESHYTPGTSLVGFKVEASDGHIGKVDEHTEDVGSSYIVVDTGPWIFGKEVLIPAGTVVRVDVKEKTVNVNLTKDQIKDSPEYDKDKHRGDAAYRDQLGQYYGHDHS